MNCTTCGFTREQHAEPVPDDWAIDPAAYPCDDFQAPNDHADCAWCNPKPSPKPATSNVKLTVDPREYDRRGHLR